MAYVIPLQFLRYARLYIYVIIVMRIRLVYSSRMPQVCFGFPLFFTVAANFSLRGSL